MFYLQNVHEWNENWQEKNIYEGLSDKIQSERRRKRCTVDTIRRVSRYQKGNQNRYIDDEQTTQWSKEKVQKVKQ